MATAGALVVLISSLCPPWPEDTIILWRTLYYNYCNLVSGAQGWTQPLADVEEALGTVFWKPKPSSLNPLRRFNCALLEKKEKQLEDITKNFSKLEANILGVIRNEKFIFLKKKDVMKKQDKAYVIINSSQMSDTLESFGHSEKIYKNIRKMTLFISFLLFFSAPASVLTIFGPVSTI